MEREFYRKNEREIKAMLVDGIAMDRYDTLVVVVVKRRSQRLCRICLLKRIVDGYMGQADDVVGRMVL